MLTLVIYSAAALRFGLDGVLLDGLAHPYWCPDSRLPSVNVVLGLTRFVSRVSPDSVERIHWNEEKDAPKEKINREIYFPDLKSPPRIFAPLFGEVGREIHTTRPQ